MLWLGMQVKHFVFLNWVSGDPPALGLPMVRAPWGELIE